VAQVNLIVRAVIPTCLYSAVRQGPTNHIRVGRPRSGHRFKGVGPIGGDQLTFSPLISLPSFNFISFTFVHSITDKRIEHISSSWLIIDRFNSYNTPLCSKIDTSLWAFFCPGILGFPLNPCWLHVLGTRWVISLF